MDNQTKMQMRGHIVAEKNMLAYEANELSDLFVRLSNNCFDQDTWTDGMTCEAEQMAKEAEQLAKKANQLAGLCKMLKQLEQA